jgi:hypothetical protein
VLDLAEQDHRRGEEERETEHPRRGGRRIEDVQIEIGLDAIASTHGEVRDQEAVDALPDAVEIREEPDHRQRHHQCGQQREDGDVGERHRPEPEVLAPERREAGPQRGGDAPRPAAGLGPLGLRAHDGLGGFSCGPLGGLLALLR